MNAALNDQILAFAAAVRTQLSDLPAEDVDDIIGGLVADLSEQAADNDGELQLSDPVAYAAELRTAAGLPERSELSETVPLSERLGTWWDERVDQARQNPTISKVLAFFVSLRPVWWVLRGIAWYMLLCLIVVSRAPMYSLPPHGIASWMLLLACVVISVQWGRDRWLPSRWLWPARTVLSIIAILALPFALGGMLQPRYMYEETATEPYIPEGLLLDGAQVGNIYAYDAEGNLLEGVQLYTSEGTPLNIRGQYTADNAWEGTLDDGQGNRLAPWKDSFRRDLWNVYPLRVAETNPNTGAIDLDSAAVDAPPYAHAPVEVQVGEDTDEESPLDDSKDQTDPNSETDPADPAEPDADPADPTEPAEEAVDPTAPAPEPSPTPAP